MVPSEACATSSRAPVSVSEIVNERGKNRYGGGSKIHSSNFWLERKLIWLTELRREQNAPFDRAAPILVVALELYLTSRIRPVRPMFG